MTHAGALHIGQYVLAGSLLALVLIAVYVMAKAAVIDANGLIDLLLCLVGRRRG